MTAITPAVVPHRALLVRQGAVIDEGRNSATARHALPLAGRGRRRISAAIVAPTSPCIVHLSRRAAGSVEGSDRGAAMWRREPLSDGRGSTHSALPEPPTAGREMYYFPLPAPSLRTPIPLPAKCRKIARHSTSLRFLTICSSTFYGRCGGSDDGAISRFLPVLREGSVASPPCRTSAARRNIPLCPRGNDKEGSR